MTIPYYMETMRVETPAHVKTEESFALHFSRSNEREKDGIYRIWREGITLSSRCSPRKIALFSLHLKDFPRSYAYIYIVVVCCCFFVIGFWLV